MNRYKLTDEEVEILKAKTSRNDKVVFLEKRGFLIIKKVKESLPPIYCYTITRRGKRALRNSRMFFIESAWRGMWSRFTGACRATKRLWFAQKRKGASSQQTNGKNIS